MLESKKEADSHSGNKDNNVRREYFQKVGCYFRYSCQIWLVILSQIKRINYLLFYRKSSKNRRFSGDFRGIEVN